MVSIINFNGREIKERIHYSIRKCNKVGKILSRQGKVPKYSFISFMFTMLKNRNCLLKLYNVIPNSFRYIIFHLKLRLNVSFKVYRAILQRHYINVNIGYKNVLHKYSFERLWTQTEYKKIWKLLCMIVTRYQNKTLYNRVFLVQILWVLSMFSRSHRTHPKLNNDN